MFSRRTLVLAPHTDDAELGCGGTLARLIEQGTEAFICAFCRAEDSLPIGAPPDTLSNEFLRAAPSLGVPRENLQVLQYPVRRFPQYRQEILEDLVKLRARIDPDLVFLPSSQDVHQDHQVIHAEGLRAFKNVSVLGYELPWNQLESAAQAFVVLEERHLERKWGALKEYHSQLALKRPYFDREYVRSLAIVRGTQVRARWAETFEVLRFKW